ncbi:beta-1,4-glucuronyltransferase 1-like [Ornithodoros turicata]|uniref:beta-1,4-glucuronyltransferase 1-like n=1 Tax=Ornithodoros turicata TaxID=34597 RepID=UPI00313A1549
MALKSFSLLQWSYLDTRGRNVARSRHVFTLTLKLKRKGDAGAQGDHVAPATIAPDTIQLEEEEERNDAREVAHGHYLIGRRRRRRSLPLRRETKKKKQSASNVDVLDNLNRMANRGSKLRSAFRVFVALNVLFAVCNMVCLHLPRNESNPTVRTVANETLTLKPPQHRKPPQFHNKQPRQTNESRENDFLTILRKRDRFVIRSNYIVSNEAPGYDATVTLTTHATHDFLHHMPVLCRRWQGPISASLYAPGTEYEIAINKVLFLRACSDPCVRANVTWHIVYSTEHRPKAGLVIANPEDCSDDIMHRQYANYRSIHNLTYPVNVLRNSARRAAETRYILASDIELYPSGNIIPRFLDMVRRRRSSGAHEVYVLPVFEVEASQTAPLTKKVLVDMVRNKSAMFFHAWVCEECQKFPKRDQWLRYIPPGNSLGVFTTVKRGKHVKYWEPIYIGTNADPFYLEELSWEGKMDKMAQSYEMCLMGYNFNIIDNAFLVHAPGIKTIVTSEVKRRAVFVKVNYIYHVRLVDKRKKEYEKNAKNCKSPEG